MELDVTAAMTTHREKRLLEAWDKNMEEEMAMSQFLRAVSHLYRSKDN